MSGFKGVLKDGWHPKGKEGKGESWRGDFKGIDQVVRSSSCNTRYTGDYTDAVSGWMDGQRKRQQQQL